MHILKITPVTGMMLAVAAVAGLAFADGVQSSNIVGYRAEEHSDYRAQTIQFWKTGTAGQEFDLLDILDANTITEGDEFQVYNPEDGSFPIYAWDTIGFYDYDAEQYLSLQVIPGNSFIVWSDSPWTFAGEVPEMTEYVHNVVPGEYCMIGNAYPVSATLADFSTEMLSEGDEIQIYNADDGSFPIYAWDTFGWYDYDAEKYLAADADMTDGFIFLSNESDSIVQSFPSAD